ncbi:MAG: phosphotransferase [Gammaproteobacteria bacterium]|nr:phosphotransferase [Gammaproteobacteria bacterium]
MDERQQQLVEWAAGALGIDDWVISTVSADASFRRYFRGQKGASSWILVDAPPDREDSDAFCAIAARLANAGLVVPEVLARDAGRGFLVLSDLGDRVLLQALQAGPSETQVEQHVGQALAALVTLQSKADASGLPPYDERLLRQELALFPDWYLARERGQSFSTAEQADWEAACDCLVASALEQPRVFVHRDFMPRNLMVTDRGPGIIDFQDAVRGPVTYDLVSLFRDAFISWPESRIESWCAAYREQAEAAGIALPADLQQSMDLMGMQRHLKVIGIFSRLKHRDGKPHYLPELPRFFDYLHAALQRQGHVVALQGLAGLLEKYRSAA